MSKLGKNMINALKEAKKKGVIKLEPSPNVSVIRKKLHLSQREFSETYHINLGTLRKWEQHQRAPDSISCLYLKCINNAPDIVRKIINQ